MSARVAMDDFVAALEAMAASGFNAAQVQAYLAQTLIEPTALERYLLFRRGRYTRNLVHKTAAFEILVVCWGIGQRAPVHGHEGERCWARVERGKLRFTSYRLVSESPLVLQPAGGPVDGGAGYLDGPADIHAVENIAAFAAPAASLHVYARPYAECDVYDLTHGARRRVRLAYDSMDGKPAVDT